MTKNEIMSLLDSNSPLNYPLLIPLLSFVSLCASFEVGLIHSLGTLTLINIDHVRIMKSSVIKPHTKIGGIIDQSDPKHASVYGNLTQPNPYIGTNGSKNRRCMETHTRNDGHSYLIRDM